MQTSTGALISVGVVIVILIFIACFLRVCLVSESDKSDRRRIRTNRYRDAIGTTEACKFMNIDAAFYRCIL